MGGDANGPIPTPGANRWELVHCDPEAYTPIEALAAVYDDSAVTASTGSALDSINDARLLTPYDLADLAYAQTMTISTGAGRDALKWKPQTMPIATFVDLLSKHREDQKKDGLAFVLAELAGDGRRKVAVKACFGVGLDIDVGVSGAEIDKALIKMGCLAVRYTTHSNGKAATLLRKDRLIRYADKIGADLDDALVQRFLREEEHWDQAIVDTAAYVGDRHEPEGMMAQIDHAPMPKHRVVMPFAAPFVITEVAKTQDEGIRLWTEVPKAVARGLVICRSTRPRSTRAACSISRATRRAAPTRSPSLAGRC